MSLIAKTIKLTSSKDALRWGGCFSENGMFMVLEVSGDEMNRAEVIGSQVLDILLTKSTNYQNRGLNTVKNLLDEVKDNKFIETVIIGLSTDDYFYLGSIGESEVLICRNGKIGKILSANETAFGAIQLGDKFLFSSKTFLQNTEIGQRKKLAGMHLQNAEITGQQLMSKSELSGASALLILFERQVISKEAFPTKMISKKQKYKEIIQQKWQNLISFIKKRKATVIEDEAEAKSKKTLLTIAVILITLLTLSIFFNINHSVSTNKYNRLKQTFDLVSHQYDEAVSLIDLNPIRARILLSDSKISLSQLLKEFPKNSKEYREVSDWLNKIAEKEVAAYKIYKFTNVPVYFDINLVKNSGVGTKLALYKNTAAILDSKNKVVYSLSLDNKQAAIIAGSDVVKEANTIAIHGKNVYVLTDEGIVGIDIGSKTSRLALKKDEKWGDIVSLTSFGGSLYLLDKTNNAIWKYIATETGFTTRSNYLNLDVKANFAASTKMMIDGSVWVLSGGGEILKFSRGIGEPFSFKGIEDTINTITTIFTSDVEKNLYVLDRESSRILVFDKDGNYLSQYQWDDLKNADDILVSETLKKIFVLSASKIYAMEVKL